MAVFTKASRVLALGALLFSALYLLWNTGRVITVELVFVFLGGLVVAGLTAVLPIVLKARYGSRGS